MCGAPYVRRAGPGYVAVAALRILTCAGPLCGNGRRAPLSNEIHLCSMDTLTPCRAPRSKIGFVS
jgi:hypothetical protein